EVVGQSLVSATLNTAAYGGSFGQALEMSAVSNVAAVGAGVIGQFNLDHGLTKDGLPGQLAYVGMHSALGCAASAAEGTGCAGGAIGGAASAFFNSKVDQLLGGDTPAALQTTISMLTAGGLAAVAGVNVQGAMTAAENETLNNYLSHRRPSPMTPSEQERSDRVAAACSSGDSDACKAARQWDALSQKRDADLASACAGAFSSPACRSQVAAALAAGNDVHAVNGTMYAFDPNAPAIKNLPDKYAGIYSGSFDGQIAQSTADGLQLVPVELPGVGLLGKIGNWFGLGTADASRLAGPVTTSLDSSAGAANSVATNGVGAFETLSANDVRFSQNTVSFNKTDRLTGGAYTYDDLVQSMRTNGWQGAPVDVVEMPDGNLTSMDNTRIAAAREAGINVQANVRGFNDPLTSEELSRFAKPEKGFNPKTWGEAISGRIGSQTGGFGRVNPNGAYQPPRITGKPGG
ncbi:DUF6862 domain-containing protein, partial [Trinickia fusca]|uniref:DUF6862 domain-containing protein n=1 Tax=Trinickia fusca TaxID=2419777 RepID=UPI001FEA9B75